MPDPVSAIVGSAVVGGVTSVIGANKAAGAAKDANAATVNEQRRQYDVTREDFRPYREVGVGALSSLADIYGLARPAAPGSASASPFAKYSRIPMPEEWVRLGKSDAEWDAYVRNHLVTPQYDVTGGPKGINARTRQYIDHQIAMQDQYGGQEGAGFYTGTGGAAAGDVRVGGDGRPVDRTGGFYQSPGYQFRLSEGRKAQERSAAARGRLFSGGTVKAVENYAQGVASDEWGRWLAGLQSLAGVGQSSTGSTAAAGANAANVISSSNTAAGAQRGSAYLSGAEGINNSVQGGLGNWVLYNAVK